MNTEVQTAGISVDGTAPVAERDERRQEKRVIVVSCVLILLLVFYFKYFNYRWFWYEPVFQFYSLGVAAYIVTRVIFSCFYRVPEDRGFLPRITVAIAVKDEEGVISETVQHCYDSGYPPELMEVIVVDDGSTDNTWDVIQGLAQDHDGLRVFRFDQNKGKRHAMALAAREASGEIIVFVDSDSFVEKGAIHRLVQPFADGQVGAVAGNISISVDDDWILSKMERVRYFVSHRVIKASESIFDAVTCCSGAFSAYRRAEVLRVLDWWLSQRFLGTSCTFGDDRALTNQILKHNKVVFHHGAVAWTRAPETWSKFFRQQLRWKKSWTRETWVAAQIMYRKHPAAALSYYTGVIMTLISPLIVLRALVIMPIFASASAIPYLIGLVLVYLFFCLIFRYHTASRYWLYGLAFAGLYIGVLCWQNYYAIATVRRTHWGTR